MDVSSTIRTARRKAGLSQTELARRIGTSQATISAYENGRKQPSVDTLDRLLAASGHRLKAERDARRASEPSAEGQERAARTLLEVLALAEALPSRHDRTLRYPRLPQPSGTKG